MIFPILFASGLGCLVGYVIAYQTSARRFYEAGWQDGLKQSISITKGENNHVYFFTKTNE